MKGTAKWQADNADRYFIAQKNTAWRIPCSNMLVSAAQLQHRIPCWGYVFDEMEEGVEGGSNASSSPNGRQHNSRNRRPGTEQQSSGAEAPTSTSSSQAASASKGRRVVILGDTMDSSSIAPIAYNADMLMHEATFSGGMEQKARVAQHSTAWMAGQFANAIRARSLVLTHFSARYNGDTERELTAEMELEHQKRALRRLLDEASREYKSNSIYVARDYYTFHVAVKGD